MADTSRSEADVAPSRTDPIIRVASTIIGGPVGRYAVLGARGAAGVASALMVMGAAMLALGVFQKGHCLVKGWVDPDQFWRACYSDIVVVNVSSGLADRSLPYTVENPTDQPLGGGLVMWAMSLISPHSGGDLTAQQWIFGLWALIAMALIAAAVLALVAIQPHRPWQAAHLAVSPVIAVLALVSVDLCAVVLVIWALWAWHRQHPVVCGALLGVAFLFRPYPLIFVLALVLLAWRSQRTHQGMQVLISAAVGAIGIYLPFLLVVGDPLLTAPRRWLSSAPGFGALSLVPSLNGLALSTTAATVITVSGWVIATIVGWWLAGRALPRTMTPSHSVSGHSAAGRRRLNRVASVHTVVAVAAPMILIVMLTAKSVSVQTGLWVLPFLALSTLPWRDHLIWAAAEIVHFEAAWLHIGFSADPGRGLPGDAYSIAIAARSMMWAWVLLRVWSMRPVSQAPAATSLYAPSLPAQPTTAATAQ